MASSIRPVGLKVHTSPGMLSRILRKIVFALSQRLLGTFLVVDVGGRTDEFEDLSFCIAQDHSLIEVPAICPVLSAERPGFKRKTVSRAYSIPKALRRRLPILRVDRCHPGLGMRPDEVKSLTGEFKPNPIHEIRCPIRLERPGGHRKLLQQRNLELQLRIGLLQLTIKAARLGQPFFAGAAVSRVRIPPRCASVLRVPQFRGEDWPF